MAARTLALRKEALTELSTDDLEHVVGGQELLGGLTGYYPSVFDPCRLTLGC